MRRISLCPRTARRCRIFVTLQTEKESYPACNLPLLLLLPCCLSCLVTMMAYLSLIAVLFVGTTPVADAFTMSVRPTAAAGSGVQRKDFLKQIAGATTAAVAGVAYSPLASVAASSECNTNCRLTRTVGMVFCWSGQVWTCVGWRCAACGVDRVMR